MKIYPDGTQEGLPEELAAFRHIDAAMTAKDAVMKKRKQSPPAPTRLALPAGKKKNIATPAEILRVVKDLDEGRGVTAAKVAQRLGIDTKTAYNRLYRSQSLGHLVNQEGRFSEAVAS